MIVNPNRKIDYLNSKVKSQLNEFKSLEEGLAIDKLINYSSLIDAVNYVEANGSEYSEKFTSPTITKNPFIYYQLLQYFKAMNYPLLLY